MRSEIASERIRTFVLFPRGVLACRRLYFAERTKQTNDLINNNKSYQQKGHLLNNRAAKRRVQGSSTVQWNRDKNRDSKV